MLQNSNLEKDNIIQKLEKYCKKTSLEIDIFKLNDNAKHDKILMTKREV